jgi:hypothetical protein
MNIDVLTQYLKESLLKNKQIPTHVNDPPKKPATRVKIEPVGSQKVRHESERPRITWLKHLIVPSAK